MGGQSGPNKPRCLEIPGLHPHTGGNGGADTPRPPTSAPLGGGRRSPLRAPKRREPLPPPSPHLTCGTAPLRATKWPATQGIRHNSSPRQQGLPGMPRRQACPHRPAPVEWPSAVFLRGHATWGPWTPLTPQGPAPPRAHWLGKGSLGPGAADGRPLPPLTRRSRGLSPYRAHPPCLPSPALRGPALTLPVWHRDPSSMSRRVLVGPGGDAVRTREGPSLGRPRPSSHPAWPPVPQSGGHG